MDQADKPSGQSIATLVALPLLLVAPGLAVYRGLSPPLASYAGGWVTAVSLLTFGIYYLDKRRAEKNGPRTPEAMLHLLELLGG
ncbi:MAG: DUF1294 domain-containing protein, partial [Oleiharenicola lentus]